MDEAIALVKELLNVPEGYQVMFLQGGASTQFSMIPFNLLDEGDKAAYTDTGAWAKKAIKEAKNFGEIDVIGSSADKTYSYLPELSEIAPETKYLHVTSNNTIYGTQIHEFPKVNCPLVADMSSDIFSRQIDVSQFGIIYAGAQKNMGCAGVTLVIVRDSLLGKLSRFIPSMMDYRIHIKNESMFNTPPVFSIYVAQQTLAWLKKEGGIVAIQKKNEAKANRLYAEIDKNPLFKGVSTVKDRSFMNVTFVMEDSSKEGDFLEFTKKHNLSGLKGHRSIGGFRASIYNAMEDAGVDALIKCMQDFSKA